MKIEKLPLTEDFERADAVADKLNAAYQDIIAADTATVKDLVADAVQGAAEENKAVDVKEVATEAKLVSEVAKFVRNPYVTAKPSKIKRTLQRSLETILDQREVGFLGTKNFPNVIVWGLAGFGKTAIIQEFCEDHRDKTSPDGFNLFECDAKNLDAATVGGIPYPTTDPVTGVITQSPIASEYWNDLDKPNTILFFDELNRANGRIRGSLLTLINEHKLPGTIKDPKTGKTRSIMKYYPNILFSVIAINPADDVFEDNWQLDPAMISRNAVIIRQEPDMKEFYSHLKKLYGAVSKIKNLPQRLSQKYSGQFDIASKLLTSRGKVRFDNADEVRKIYQRQGKSIDQYFNYRTFLLLLLRSDGTKNDYLDIIKNESSLSDERIAEIENALRDYQDKQVVGNSVFTKNAPTSPLNATQTNTLDINIEQQLQDFADKFNKN